MKKIYALLAGVLVAGSAVAAPVRNISNSFEASRAPQVESLAADFNPAMTILPNQAPDGMSRVVTDGQNNEWMMMIRLNESMIDMFGLYNQGDNGEKIELDFEDYPFYCVTMNAIRYTQSGAPTYSVPMYTVWPCKAWADDDCWGTNGMDWTAAAGKYGSLEAAQAPCSIEQFLSYPLFESSAGTYILPMLGGFYSIPCILDPAMLGGGVTWNGQSLMAVDCVLNQDFSLNFSNKFYVDWKSYDPDLGEVKMDLHVALGPDGTTATVNDLVALTGDPTIFGFKSLEFTPGEVHIYNCGITTQDTYWGINYENAFDPVLRYYAAWCSDVCSYAVHNNQTNEDLTAWTADEPGTQPWQVLEGTPVFFWGAFYAPEDAAFEGLWTMPEPEYVMNDRYVITSWQSVPAAYELIPYLDAAVCETDGLCGVWSNFYCIPAVDKTFVGAGDKTYGFNYSFTQDGWGENRIYGAFTDSYYYHGDPNNFDDISLVQAVGAGDYNAITGAAAVEVVESNAPVVSTQYFNLQGQRLSVAPEHGIFIQRDIKADGTAKAVKVAK